MGITRLADVTGLDRVGTAGLSRDPFRAVGGLLDPHQERSWVRGVDLTPQAVAWVPEESVSMNSVADQLGEPGLARSSNGLASGNSLEQAMLHAPCEVVERDAESRWRAASESHRVRLDTVEDPFCRRMIGMVRSAGLHLAVWDVASHTTVPCYGCVVLAPPQCDGVLWADDLRAVVRAVTSGTRHAVVAVGLTRQELGVSVAKVIVTRLEGPFGMCEPAEPGPGPL
ncbi:YcaO-like family protein [Streptomyces montanus]|uniref:YcaO-like family protein n=1 Tax=Streptomyces montanus TaxID=2580423 RepID=UPI0014864A0D|nr:YcaO-like family protein [Streptomyces montanus]